ncbi:MULTISPECIES: DsbA family oxidoreductase [Lysinibacillus]|jgi:predicted DsbA family dithiol-disulfide isomerase|uniref:DsbA family oxidoreductase n=1 Tax=Lysinibacillus TaxID=400634 RepID=UPI0004D67345|nr:MULTISPECIES: DsbA family oxidoreductase [Lysinibacillus]MDC6269510.1 DsbA family oxidoreductase [Lysinibacillus sphaericus]AJK86100.1 peptidoglycan hydrolase [Lysinibacillus fusiformis]KHK55608.1 peptidoglycan hydrolase [Lysinibacillus sp. A1]MDN4970707.1 DsbA family oxidoreductase [Lysinibacillus fusiformis]UXJ68639.1 DsbA family oxidoreductase [Lysinibacillus fusiformis]
MKIEVFTDFTCPFCYIAKRELERAIKTSGYTGQVEIEYKAYQIGPETPKVNAPNFLDTLAMKYNATPEEVHGMTENMASRAAEVGLTYNFEMMTTAHTEKAHRLAKWTQQFGQASAYTEALMAGYFMAGEDVNDDSFLLKVIAQLGLDIEEAQDILATKVFLEALDQDRYDAQQLGIQSVPFFVFENRYGIKGAEPNEVFVRTLHQTAKIVGIQPTIQLMGNGEDTCTDGACNL